MRSNMASFEARGGGKASNIASFEARTRSWEAIWPVLKPRER